MSANTSTGLPWRMGTCVEIKFYGVFMAWRCWFLTARRGQHPTHWLLSTRMGTGGGLGTARGFGCGGGLGCGGGAGLGGGLGVGFGGGEGFGGGVGLGFCSTRGGGGTACGGGFGAGAGAAPEGSLLNLSLNSSAVSSPSKPGPGTK